METEERQKAEKIMREKFLQFHSFFQCSDREKYGAFTIFLIAVNRLHEVSDLYGFEAGEALLQDRLRELRRAVDKNGKVFQTGRGKFVVLTGELTPNQAGERGQQLLQRIRSPFLWKEKACFITANIGIVLVPEETDKIEKCMADAEIALYDSCRKGECRISLFCSSMRKMMTRQVQVETALEQALEQQELQCVFQPWVNVDTGRICAAEALIRWESPSLGKVSPEEFIPLLEKSGLIGPFDFWMLESVCVQIRRWRENGIPPVPVSVNISAVDLEQDHFYERVMEIVTDNHVEPRDIGLEVTERILMTPDSCCVRLLNRFRMEGFTILVDDFGVQYSSLQYVGSLPVDIIKIDRSFIQRMSTGESYKKIVKSMIFLARELHIKTVGEGVEQAEEAEVLKNYQCDMIQGFFYYHPMNADQMGRLLSKERSSCEGK
jgi:diguanylate cyclase (GGDEF)-like protein